MVRILVALRLLGASHFRRLPSRSRAPLGSKLARRLALEPSGYVLLVRNWHGGSPWSRRDTFAQALWGQLRYFWPLQCLLVAVGRIYYQEWAALLAWIAAAYIGWAQFANRSEEAKQVALAPADDELRERVAELAEKIGVTPPEVWVKKPVRGEELGAWASTRAGVVLSEELLRSLTRREVNAVVSHELKHLKSGHPWLSLLALIGSIGVAFIAGTVAYYYVQLPIPQAAFDLAVFAVGMLGFYAVSRRFERKADEAAVDISGDGVSFIRGLAKVESLTALPNETTGLREIWMTHPTYRNRIEAAARQSGISTNAVEEILQRSDDSSGHYNLLAQENEEDEDTRVFSKQLRHRVGSTMAWALQASRLGAAVAGAILIPRVSTGPASVIGWIAVFCVAALVLREAVEMALGRVMLARPRSTLNDRLRQRGFDPVGPNVMRANYSPIADCRNYDMFNWLDEGLLYRGRDALSFVGESTMFTLRRDRIISIKEEVRRDWQTNRDIRVNWKDDAGEVREMRFCDPHENEVAALFFSPFSAKLVAWSKGDGQFVEPPGRSFQPPDVQDHAVGDSNVAMTPGLVGQMTVFLFATSALTDAFFGFDLDTDYVLYASGWHLVTITVVSGFLDSIWSLLRDMRSPPPFTAPRDDVARSSEARHLEV